MYQTRVSRRIRGLALFCGSAIAVAGASNQAHSSEGGGEPQAFSRPMGRSPSQGLRPIGAPSPVDAFTRSQPVLPPADVPSRSAGAGGQIAQTAYMQGGGFAVPPSSAAAAPAAPSGAASPRPAPAVTGGSGLQAPPLSGGQPAAPPAITTTTPLPEGLQPVPSTAPLTPPPQSGSVPLVASPSDATPVPQPRLGTTWATADNCNLVSPPSGYRAEFVPCTPVPVMPITYAAPPAVVVPPTIMPGVAPPVLPATAGHRPLFTLGQENYNVQLGQGIIGQPTAYVPGQHFRNFIRYLSP